MFARQKFSRPEWRGRYRVVQGDDGFFHAQKRHAFTPKHVHWTGCGMEFFTTAAEAMSRLDEFFINDYKYRYGVVERAEKTSPQ